MKWLLAQHDSDLVVGASVVPGWEMTWTFDEERPSHQFADGWVGQTRSQDDKRTYHQQTPGVQVFEHSSNKCIDEAKVRRRSWNAFQNRTRQSSHAREDDLGVQSTLCFFAVKNGIQNKMPDKIQTSSLELNQEEVTAVAHHRPQVCAMDEH